eukprot:Hpha_TRINITY_DN16695_c7_g2::TRINITY_DN16695_c7_g2_i3::g.182568::m.182568
MDQGQICDSPREEEPAGLTVSEEDDWNSLPPLQTDDAEYARVVVLTGMSIDVDIKKLVEDVEMTFETQVVRWLPVWNKNALLLEFAQQVLVTKALTIGGTSVVASTSPKRSVELPSPSRTVNVRVFLLNPVQDYVGTKEEIAKYKKVRKLWMSSKCKEVQAIRRLVEEVAESPKCVILPRRSRMVSAQRCYTQLLFKYSDTESATRALAQMDGRSGCVSGRRVTVRADFAKPVGNDS